MADSDLTITISGKDLGVKKMLDKIVSSLDQMEKNAKETTKTVGDSSKKIASSFDSITSKAQKMSGAISNALKPASALIGKFASVIGVGGLTGIIYKSVTAFSDFENAMKEVSTLISGDSTDAIKQYTEEIKKLSLESGKSSVELTKGLYQVISAGTKGADTVAGAMKLLDISQKAATAGVTDTFTAVDILTTALNSYNTSTEDASKFADILFTTVKYGKTTFAELANAIGGVAANAAGAGVSFLDTNAALAKLTQGGLSTKIAVTSLNSLIVSIINPTKELSAAFDRLGTKYRSISEYMEKEGFGKTMRLLNTLTGGNTESIQKMVGSVEALRGASILAGQGIGDFEGILKSFEKTAGAQDEAFKKMTETFSHQLSKVKVKFEEVFISIGTKIMPDVLASLNKLSEWFDKNSESIIKFVTDLSSSVVEFVSFLVKNAKTIAYIFAGIWSAEKLAATAQGIIALTTAIKGMNAALLATGGKVAAVLGGIAALAYGVNAISERSAELRADESNITRTKGRGGVEYQKERAREMGWGELPVSEADIDRESEARGEAVLAEIRKEEMARTVADEKLTKKRLDTLKDLHNLEMNNVNEYQKVHMKYDAMRLDWENKVGASAEERQKALALIESLREKDLFELQEKYAKEQTDARNAEQKWDAYKSAFIEKELEKHHQMRMDFIDAEEKRMQDSAIYVENLQLSLMDEEEQVIKAFKDDIEKINKSMTFATEAQRKQAVQLRTEVFEREQLKRGTAGIGTVMREEFSYDHWAKIAFDFTNNMTTGISNFTNTVLFGYTDKIGEVLSGFVANIEEVFTLPIEKMLGSMGNLMYLPFDKIFSIFDRIISGDSKNVAEDMTKEFVAFMDQLAQQLPAALEWFANEGVPLILDSFVTNLPVIIDALVAAIPVILQAIVGKLDMIILPLVEGFLKVIPAIIEQIPLMIEKIAEMIPQIIVMIVKELPKIIESLGVGIVKSIGGFFKGLFTGFIDALKAPDKSELAAKKEAEVRKKAIAMGYTESEAQAIATESYERAMGRDFDAEKMADYYYNEAYYKAIKDGKTPEEAASIAAKVRDAEMQKYSEELGVNREEMQLGVMHPGHDEGGAPLPAPSLPSAAIHETPSTPMKDPETEAQTAYDEKFSSAMAKADADWAEKENFMRMRGEKEAAIRKAKKEFYASAKEDAYAAAEEAYRTALEQVQNENKTNPDYESFGVMHKGGYIDSAIKLANAIRAHSGMYIPKRPGLALDEVPIIAQAGEAFMNRDWVNRAGGKNAINRMNQTGQVGTERSVNSVYIEHNMSEDTAKVIDRLVAKNFRSGAGKLYERMNFGSPVGFKPRRG